MASCGNQNQDQDKHLIVSSSSEEEQQCSTFMWFMRCLGSYFLGLGKIFVANIRSGIMYTALIDFAIFLYKSRKATISIDSQPIISTP